MTGLPITSPQNRRLKRYLNDLVRKVLSKERIDREGLEALLGHPDLHRRLWKDITQCAVVNRFRDESTPRSLGGQLFGADSLGRLDNALYWLKQWFPNLHIENVPTEKPSGADVRGVPYEGWLAIPKWECIAPTYCEATLKVLEIMRAEVPFFDFSYAEHELETGKIRERPEKVKSFELLRARQEADVLFVPGSTVTNVWTGYDDRPNLGIYETALVLLRHRIRAREISDIMVRCPADIVGDDEGGYGDGFSFDDGRVTLSPHFWGYSFGYYGGVHAGFPQA